MLRSAVGVVCPFGPYAATRWFTGLFNDAKKVFGRRFTQMNVAYTKKFVPFVKFVLKIFPVLLWCENCLQKNLLQHWSRPAQKGNVMWVLVIAFLPDEAAAVKRVV